MRHLLFPTVLCVCERTCVRMCVRVHVCARWAATIRPGGPRCDLLPSRMAGACVPSHRLMYGRGVMHVDALRRLRSCRCVATYRYELSPSHMLCFSLRRWDRPSESDNAASVGRCSRYCGSFRISSQHLAEPCLPSPTADRWFPGASKVLSASQACWL